ncbi:HupE/UreJ family protein [Streptomyces sp. NPDC005281]|uniref:HupE/UreJ family protein n=1 Tax=Streptomyces sp. NPDC005281 TaxID=3155712 RepID=UPI00339EDA3D
MRGGSLVFRRCAAAADRRCVRPFPADGRPVGAGVALGRIGRVMAAFTLGHSVALAVTALSRVEIPGRPIEAFIAAGILVGTLHAIRPQFPGREALVADSAGLHTTLTPATLAVTSAVVVGCVLFTRRHAPPGPGGGLRLGSLSRPLSRMRPWPGAARTGALDKEGSRSEDMDHSIPYAQCTHTPPS